MAELKVQGSGGYVIADLTDEQAKKQIWVLESYS